MTDFAVTFLGTGGTSPSPQRGLPATLFKRGGTKLLVDCGEGTQRQLWISEGGLTDLDAIFLTHYHSDHILGLPGLLNSYQLRGRDRPIPIYGPKPLMRNLNRFRTLMGGHTFSLLRAHELAPGERVDFADGFSVMAVPVQHNRGSGHAFGYRLAEQNRPGRFDVEKAKSLGVHPGPDFGKLQAGHTVRGVKPDDVIGPERPGRTVVISGDTAPTKSIVMAAHEVDLLIHEASLLTLDRDWKEKTEHSTALDAARIAREARVKKLALYHISQRHRAKQVLKEAWNNYMGAIVPNDFDRIDLHLEG
jgi:ribonuclease Z